MRHKLIHIKIAEEADIAKAISAAGDLAKMAGCGKINQCLIATAVSELARNIFVYALKGEVRLMILEKNGQSGIEVIAEDKGPGIRDIAGVMGDDYISAQGLGMGLKRVKRLMDEFIIDSKPGRGTNITAKKWC
ncbi:MAG: anti-sigma regulatory factor [Chlamydiota bacterium]